MKKLFFLLCINYFFSQNSVSSSVPTSPNVASLLKYAEIPVNNYNGTTSFSIPLYDIKDGDLNIPISASYYSTGLKVEEEASNIGLGWTLNAGGVIHVKGDLSAVRRNYVPTLAEANQEPDNDLRESNLIYNYTENGCSFFTEDGSIESPGNSASIIKSSDYIMLIYNFNGYSGKFIKDYSGNYISMDKNNIKLQAIENGFLATTPDGVSYYFQLAAKSHMHSSTDCTTTSHQYEDSYYLTKIVTPKNRIANFIYSSGESLKGLPHLIQNHTVLQSVTSSNPLGASWSTSGYSMLFNEKVYGYSQTDAMEYTLKEITTDNAKITFESSSREDVENAKRIDNIKVEDKNSNVVKKINFIFDYFIGDVTFGDYTNQAKMGLLGGCGVMPYAISTAYKSKRLKLNQIRFSEISTTEGPAYSFKYNSNKPLPLKTSMSQDLWGYYNGKMNNTLLPNVNKLGYKDDNIPFYFVSNPENSDREADEEYSKAGLLEIIEQPTGGITRMQYESNHFTNPSIKKTLVKVTKTVTDYNSTSTQSVEFTIPAITNQSIKLSMSLTCNRNGACNIDVPVGSYDCPPYSNSGFPPSQITHPDDRRLYGIIEKKVNGNWQVVGEYSRNTQELIDYGNAHGICGLFEKDLTNIFTAGQYRMTANYPDNKVGYLGGPWVDMKLTYFEEQTITYPNKGAGLRIKNIRDYDLDGKKNNEKNFVYNNGLLMTKPVFYRVRDRNDITPFSVTNAPSCSTVAIIPFCTWGESSFLPMVYNTKFVTLNSDTVIPYSYNAQGSLVGYTEVTISYGENTIGNPSAFNGEVVYKYNNLADYSIYYPSRPAGLPETRYLRNGTLSEKITYKIKNSGSGNFAKEIVKYEKYDFIVKNQKRYWAFITEYLPVTYFCLGNTPVTGTGYDYNSNFLFFYHIKTGKILLNSKEETDYLNGGSVTKNFTYSYNSKNQLISEKVYDSNGDEILNKTYYPNDLLMSDQAVQMVELVNANQIDIPIREEQQVNNIKVSEQETVFEKNEHTSNLLLPTKVYTNLGSSGINKSITSHLVSSFERYDSKGNLLQYRSRSGLPTVLIWGYNGSVPIAKVEGGATYPGTPLLSSDIPLSLIDGIVSESNNDIDNTSEIALLSALQTFRKDNALSKYLITTYTYNPLVGVTNITNPNGINESYFYDSQNRLIQIKNDKEQLLKQFDYGYSGIQYGNMYFNSIQSQVFTKNDCQPGFVGNDYTYIVPKESYMSHISQADADSKAQAELFANGQKMANTYGICGESCPFTLSSSIDSTGYTSSVIKNGTTITASINIKVNTQNMSLNWIPGVVIGSIGGNCTPPAANNIREYYDVTNNTKWRIIITPSSIYVQLIEGSISATGFIHLEFQYEK